MLKYALCGLVVLGLSGGVAAWALLRPQDGSRPYAPDDGHRNGAAGGEGDVPVKAIHPRRDPAFAISAEGLASVEAFFQDDLRARQPGFVSYVGKDLGDPVTKGELLVEIDVPDLKQDVLQKETMITQRVMERNLALAKVEDARAMLEIGKIMIRQKELEVEEAEILRDRRKQIYDRVSVLGKRDVLNASMAEEEEKNWRAAVVAVKTALIAVERAKADLKEKESALEAAKADVELKDAQVEVARKDRDRALALAGYARITAPFDGVVINRTVDVGAFVQNAATANTEPMMTVARTDIVTVVGKAPEKAAPYVSNDTEVWIQLDELPGVSIRGKVTRYSPSIQTKDRNMKVEVDLYNGTRAEYDRFVATEYADLVAPLAAQNVFGGVNLLAASRNVVGEHRKGRADRLPLFPQVVGAGAGNVRLLPGMSGRMRFALQRFHDCYLVPRSAVFSPGGRDYIMEVRDGVTVQVPVKVQVSDGKLVKLAMVTRESGGQEVLRELTGDEVILLNRQLEIGPGKPVTVTIEKW
jgi:multidrug resistance efflux pump